MNWVDFPEGFKLSMSEYVSVIDTISHAALTSNDTVLTFGWYAVARGSHEKKRHTCLQIFLKKRVDSTLTSG